MKVQINDLGTIGIIRDKPAHELPIGAWSAGNNVTFRDGKLQKAKGNTEAYSSPGCRPQWLLPYLDPDGGEYHWIYPGIDDSGNGKIYTVTGVTHTDRTRSVGGNYSPDLEIPWTGGVLNGLVVVNNGVDVPQKWDRTGGTLNADFEDMANWPSGYTARSIRPFRDFLIAMDVDDGVSNPSRNPYRVMWSDASTGFTEPSTWVSGASNLAGDVYLAQGGDHVIDGGTLRGNFIIYKENSTYIMRYVGGNAVMQVDRLFNEHGILAPRCYAEFGDDMHFVVTKGDVVVHDGNTAKSVADERVREEIFNEIDTTYYLMAFCTPYYKEEEIWFCYSTDGDGLADKAAIWNYKTGAWSFRKVTNCAHIAYGTIVETGGDTWATISTTWTTETGVWSSSVYSPAADDLVMIQRGGTEASASDTTANATFQQVDSGNTFDGSLMTSYARMEKMDIAGQGVEDPSVIKFLRRLYPKIDGGPVKIRTGSSMSQNGTVNWSDYMTYDPTAGAYKVDVRETGRFLAFEISSTEDVDWQIDSLDMDIEITSSAR